MRTSSQDTLHALSGGTHMGGSCLLEVKQVVSMDEAGLPQHICSCYVTNGIYPELKCLVPSNPAGWTMLNMKDRVVICFNFSKEAWILCEASWLLFWFTWGKDKPQPRKNPSVCQTWSRDYQIAITVMKKRDYRGGSDKHHA